VTYVSESHVSYNGGNGGVEVRPTPQQESYATERHVGPVSAQTQHVQQARSNPELRASANEGKPPIAATTKPADFKTGVVASRQAGGAYKAPPNAARGNEARPANEARPSAENHPANNAGAPPNTNGHASELQQHKFTPPNTGNTATDNKYQQQQVEQRQAPHQTAPKSESGTPLKSRIDRALAADRVVSGFERWCEEDLSSGFNWLGSEG
jgi:hypothetical protein